MTHHSKIRTTALLLLAAGSATACSKAAPTAPAAPPPPPATTVQWTTSATQYRAQVGQIINISCPANGAPGSVWGSDVYSDDSSICTAALHSGRVTLQAGGTIAIQIAPGAPSYAATTRNGVTSRPWGVWQGSFTIVGGAAPGLVASPVSNTPPPPPPAAAPGVPGAPTPIGWDADGAHTVQTGQTALVGCPPGGTANSIWGTDTYSSDSSVCTAAVHAGLIQLATGGVVRVNGVAGAPGYMPSTRNGVTSAAWGAWSASFTVAPATAAPAGAAPNK